MGADHFVQVFAWYGTLLFALYVVKLLAMQVLFLPYLRTFFRIKTAVLRDSPLTMRVEAGRKIKLRNSLIRRDGETGQIWLRSRGFNRFQFPHAAVAALNVDRLGKAITGYEIRFSSVGLVMVLFFFWMTYRMVLAAPVESGSPLPALFFLGIPAVSFVIIVLFAMRPLISRMEDLVADALSELGGANEPTVTPRLQRRTELY
jgi:hypothetical protein